MLGLLCVSVASRSPLPEVLPAEEYFIACLITVWCASFVAAMFFDSRKI
jgi:hypothetical protein